jgi:hypothetical protein
VKPHVAEETVSGHGQKNEDTEEFFKGIEGQGFF